jgi:hypothetical protein
MAQRSRNPSFTRAAPKELGDSVNAREIWIILENAKVMKGRNAL